MNLLLFGPPGAGKGTQSAFLVERLKKCHISTGDLFRSAIKEGTPLGKEVKSILESGKLVPDSLTINLVKEVLGQLNGKSFILDGFPRNVNQAEALDRLLSDSNLSLGKAVFLEVDSSSVIERLSGRRTCRGCGAIYHISTKMMKDGKTCDSCGSSDIYQRDDDRPESIKTRLDIYAESTQPLKDYYQKSGIFVAVDGMGEVESVFKRIKEMIEN